MKYTRKLCFECLENKLVLSSLKPLIITPNSINIKEDTSSQIQIKVLDLDSKNLSITIRSNDGFLSSDNINAQQSIKFSGPWREINKKIKGIKYTPKLDSNKSDMIKINVSDNHNRSTKMVKVNISSINDAPQINSKELLYLKQDSLYWNEPLFSDVDSNKLKVSLRSEASITVDHPSFKKYSNNVFKLEDTKSNLNKLFSEYGKVRILNSEKEFSLKIIVNDGNLKTFKDIIISKKPTLFEIANESVSLRATPDKEKNIFSIMDHQNKNYVRNTNSWVYDLDLTSISPWNSAGGNRLAGTLISPRHIIYATHYQLPVGSTLRFITKNNTVVERKLINKISMTQSTWLQPDITIGVLESDVPESIGYAKILPDNWKKYLDPEKEMGIHQKIPCLALDQEEKALITGLFHLSNSAIFDSYNNGPYSGFFENIIAGDSGNPAFIILNNELVLITIWTFGGGGSGTSITSYKDSINQIMHQLGGNYTLAEVNLDFFRKI